MSEFVEVKTPDLSGAALDWAVAKAEGVSVDIRGQVHPIGSPFRGSKYLAIGDMGLGFNPSADWRQGGPLIEKYKLDIGAPLENKNGPWNAATEWGHPLGYKGCTPLIAACRAIVASVLGEAVSVPKELLS